MIQNLLLLLLCWGLEVGCCVAGSLLYFRFVHLARPALGTFDGSDFALFFLALLVLTWLYLALPVPAITALFLLGVVPLLFTGLQPLFPGQRATRWIIVLVGVVILLLSYQFAQAGNSVVSAIHAITNNLLIALSSIVMANLYVQGGLRLTTLGYCLVGLAFYDAVFAWVLPLTPQLAAHFSHASIAPLVSLTLGHVRAGVGLGDLLAFGAYATLVYKSFGWKKAACALGLVACAGIGLPAVLWWWLSLSHPQQTALIPLQVCFGPAAALSLWIFARRPCWNMAHWLQREPAGVLLRIERTSEDAH